MGLLIPLIIRVFRAFTATLNLLSDWQLLRTLPWRYIGRLLVNHGWIGLAGWMLLLTVASAVLTAALPSEQASGIASAVGGAAATIGILSSWVRAGLAWYQLRGR